jgi:hypothetical protein
MSILNYSEITSSKRSKGGILLLLFLLMFNLSYTALNCFTYKQFDGEFSGFLEIEDTAGNLIIIPLSVCSFPRPRSSSDDEEERSPLRCDYCLSHNSLQELTTLQNLQVNTFIYQVIGIDNSSLISRSVDQDSQSRAPPTSV